MCIRDSANTLLVFDKPSVKLFNKKRMPAEESKPTARDIQLLLSTFKDEQVRLMKLQNQEFEKDKK